jgi:hypothetical protein
MQGVREIIPGRDQRTWEDMPQTGSDWQNKRILDHPDLKYVQKRANEKHRYRNTRPWEFYWQNTAFLRFKMSLFGAVWKADLRNDRPYLPITENNPVPEMPFYDMVEESCLRSIRE